MDNFVSSLLRSLVKSEDSQKPSIWIFGYGSLIWNPGFEYEHQMKARLRGYSRRFYQGNTTYRGTVDQPGRVVTIVEDEETSDTYGLAFKVQGWSQVVAALDHLHFREIQSGYVFRAGTIESLDNGKCVQALTVIALKDNALFMEPSADDHVYVKRMAYQIATASGKGGPNHEYLTKLADCMRNLFPQAWDEHLFQLETYMLQFLNANDCNCVELKELRLESVQAS